MFTLSSEVNGTTVTFTIPKIDQLERVVSAHLSLMAFDLLSKDSGEFMTFGLRIDVALTTRRAPIGGPSTLFASTCIGFLERVAGDGRTVSDVVISVPDKDDDAVVYYLLLIRDQMSYEWSIHDHVIVQTESEGQPGQSPDEGHFLELTFLEQLRHFATS